MKTQDQKKRRARRTQREVDYSKAKWDLVKEWAINNGYVQVDADESRLLYQKRLSWLLPPTLLEMAKDGRRLNLDFWVKADAYLILSVLTAQPPEIRLDRGGLSAMIPRKMARTLVNGLLEKLNLPDIQ